MLEKDYIKNGNLVYREEKDSYHTIESVQYATNVNENRSEGELMYDIRDILTDDVYPHICEHSGMTSTFLTPATIEEARIYLLGKNADAMIEAGNANKRLAITSKAIEMFKKYVVENPGNRK